MIKKREKGTIDTFDGIGKPATAKRLKDWGKNQPVGRWRHWRQIKIRYTYIVRTWKYEEKTLVLKYVCPYGSKEYGKELLEDDRAGKSLPNEVKDALSKDGFIDNDHLTYSCIDEGDKEFGTFYLVYCIRCSRQKLPLFWEKYKQHLPEQPKVETLMDMWDELRSKEKSIGRKEQDYLGCILPNELGVIAFPNNRRFILRPCSHWNQYHTLDADVLSVQKSAVKRKTNEDAAFFKSSPNNTIMAGVKKRMTTYSASTSTATTKTGQATITGEKGFTLKLQPTITQLMDPRV